MGTRSFITIKHKDNTYSGVYCHWDGSVEHNGKILKEDYQARSKVVDLIDGGDMSSFKTNTTWESTFKEDAYTNTREEQPLYYYERGDIDDDSVYPKHFKNHQQMYKYAKNCGCEYIYTFDDTVGEDQPWWSFCGVN
jgi:hypothetical protein